jgi:hypothetical protein
MNPKLALATLLLASLVQAQDTKKYHTGQLVQMESLECTVFENPTANSSDSVVCQEYVLRGDDVLFHLRAKDVKHTVLLPVGKEVAYRIEEDRFYLRPGAGDKKEHEYRVVAMEPRDKSEPSTQTALKVNHLQ